MRLATFRHDDRLGAGRVSGDEVIPVAGARSALALVRVGTDGTAAAREAPRRSRLPLEEVELLPPLAPPRIFCVGWNYRRHFDEGVGHRGDYEAEQLPEYPALFAKPETALTAPYGPIALHRSLTGMLDWEAELAVVVGASGVNIREERALDHVFGYAVANDVTARDLQRSYGGQWFKGKSLDGSCPLGPWITTREEIPDPQVLTVSCRVNGEEKQRASTRDMIFGVARLIAELSAGMTLVPGDVILTGTPAGVGSTRTPPEWLQAGDVVETEISELGLLRNRVVDEERSDSDGVH